MNPLKLLIRAPICVVAFPFFVMFYVACWAFNEHPEWAWDSYRDMWTGRN